MGFLTVHIVTHCLCVIMCIFFGSEDILRSPRFFFGSKKTRKTFLSIFGAAFQRELVPLKVGGEEEAVGNEKFRNLEKFTGGGFKYF